MSIKLDDLNGYDVRASDISKGNIIEINKELYEVTDLDRVKPGKGGAFVQATLKNILTNRKLEQRFRTEDKVTRVNIYEIKCTFFWDDEDTMTFLRKDNNESICLNKKDFKEYSELENYNTFDNIHLMMLDDGTVIDIKY
jgi:translation elongation factor P/translation initiation factor 5A